MIAPPAHLQRQVGMKLYQASPGKLIEPYRIHTKYPFLQRWFTREGWRQIKDSIMREVKTAYAVAKLRQKTGFTRKVFYSDAEKMYKEVNTAIAEGDWHALKEFVTESMLSTIKNEIKRRDGIWHRVEWKLTSPVRINTLQARIAAVDPKDLEKAFIQVTVMIKSKQSFGAYDRAGKLVAGDPEKQIDVEDIWVFETFLATSNKKFRLCGRITL
ncbi:hypothetical protein KP509_1Z008900 [Ceratopteris richardii]|nr:hypothetical protein KP509_1Z008900 [Ceratopteris richardii]